MILWRTNMLRQTRLKVIDEVANGLSYYDYAFFRELPRLYRAIARERRGPPPRRADSLHPAHRLVDRRRPRRQSFRHRRRARRGDAAAERARPRPLPRRAAPARKRAVAGVGARFGHPGARRARRSRPRRGACSPRRALPPRRRRHVLPPCEDRVRPRSCRRAAPAHSRRAGLPERRGVRRRPRRNRGFADEKRRRDRRPRAPQDAEARRRRVRLLARSDRSEAEFRGA